MIEKGLCVTGFVVYIRGILTSMYVDGAFPGKRGNSGLEGVKSRGIMPG